MPLVTFYARYRIVDGEHVPFDKAKSIAKGHLIAKVGKQKVTQEIITDGDPDGLGDLDGKAFVVKSEATITIEEGLELKKALVKENEQPEI